MAVSRRLLVIFIVTAFTRAEDLEEVLRDEAKVKSSVSPRLAGARAPPVPPRYWSAEVGDCEDNPGFAEDCSIWAQRGFCHDTTMGKSYPEWMKKNCMVSCGYCEKEPKTNFLKIGAKTIALLLYYAWILNILPMSRPRTISIMFQPHKRVALSGLFIIPAILVYFI
ncbi:uncharacterized protein LOC120339892 [Styela clava]